MGHDAKRVELWPSVPLAETCNMYHNGRAARADRHTFIESRQGHRYDSPRKLHEDTT